MHIDEMCCAVNMKMQLFRECAILLLFEPGHLYQFPPQSYSHPVRLSLLVAVRVPQQSFRSCGGCLAASSDLQSITVRDKVAWYLLANKQAKHDMQRQVCKNQFAHLLFNIRWGDYAGNFQWIKLKTIFICGSIMV